MSWIQRLYDTYESNLDQVGKIMGEKEPIEQYRLHVEAFLDRFEQGFDGFQGEGLPDDY